MLITINRQKQYNALNSEANWELHEVFNWAEEEDSIWCIIVSLSSSMKNKYLRVHRSLVLVKKLSVLVWIS
jgi:1,4-dihydroxy-2-naphthoyl-CoA synthase